MPNNLPADGYGPRYADDEFNNVATEGSRLQTESFDLEEHSTEQQPGHIRRRRAIFKRLGAWLGGPQPPKRQVIVPWVPQLHQAPLELRDRLFPTYRRRQILLLGFYLLWTVTFILVLVYWKNTAVTYRTDAEMPLKRLDCGNTLWFSRNACGLDGELCKPFNGAFAFRCPPGCKHYQLLNPHAVGSQEVNYRPLVVGGPVYRGDSFICAAAIHAGIFDDKAGGCAITRRVGEHAEFYSSTQNGIDSIAFDSRFPLAFDFLPGSEAACNGKDLQWHILAMSVFFTVLLSTFSKSPSVFFYSSFIGIFLQVGFVSDPPNDGSLPLPSLLSVLVGRLLPALFCAVVMYKICVKTSLDGLTAYIDRTILWLGGCWLGALTNYTFDWIPLQRLTAHDLRQQPGAITALVIIIGVLCLIVLQQIYYFRLEGRLRRYLAIYGLMILGIIVALSIPGVKLRIHHYILSLLLLPGTSMQTRPSLLYQGLLIGLFINGTARWGFDSVLQTSEALQNDGQFESLLPTILEPILSIGETFSNISFPLVVPEIQWRFDGISVLVNDVERFRTFFTEGSKEVQSFFWAKNFTGPEYVRFGYLKDGHSLDYTKAGILNANGTWTKMEPGPSR